MLYIRMGLFDFFKKKETAPEAQEALDKGLEKTKEGFFSKITKAVAGKSSIDDDVLDNLEEVLVTSDVGVSTTLKIIERIEQRVAKDKYLSTTELNHLLRDEIQLLLAENNSNDFRQFEYGQHKPYVIMVVGVNGVGKTTTIGKLAHKLKAENLKVVLGAADTFRAAAVEQIKLWGERVGVRVVAQAMKPFPAFMNLLTTQYCSVVPKEIVEHYGKDFRSHPIGTGPFKFKYWKEDEILVMLKNEHYWEKEGDRQLPYLDAVKVTFISDKQSAFMANIKDFKATSPLSGQVVFFCSFYSCTLYVGSKFQFIGGKGIHLCGIQFATVTNV